MLTDNRTIIHIDMNAYFASVEQQANPALRGKPIIVCGEGRTVVATASYEAREYGIKTGMTPYEARKLCPGVINVAGDMEKYIDATRKIREVLLGFSDRVEFFSIDEAFMDVTAGGGVAGGAVKTALKIKERIRKNLGITCSVGIAPNKLLAKLASEMKKPDGLVVLKKEDIVSVMRGLPVEKLCGIGRKLTGALNKAGIRTAKALGDAPIGMLTKHFGFWGHILQRMGRGEDNSPVSMCYADEIIKSVGHSYTLPVNTRDVDVIRSYLLMLSEKVGSRMRRYGMRGRTVSLVVRYSNFRAFSRQLSFKHYLFTGGEIYGVACRLFSKYLPLYKPVRLLGISVANLIADEGQRLLLDTCRSRESITRAVDGINARYGALTVKPASLIIAERFGILQSTPPGRQGHYDKDRD